MAEEQANELPEYDREQVMERIRAAGSQVGGSNAMERFLKWRSASERNKDDYEEPDDGG